MTWLKCVYGINIRSVACKKPMKITPGSATINDRIWVPSGENLSSGFEISALASWGIILFKKRTTKVLIRLRLCCSHKAKTGFLMTRLIYLKVQLQPRFDLDYLFCKHWKIKPWYDSTSFFISILKMCDVWIALKVCLRWQLSPLS